MANVTVVKLERIAADTKRKRADRGVDALDEARDLLGRDLPTVLLHLPSEQTLNRDGKVR